MGKLKDETGNRYGKLTVIKHVGHAEISGNALWLCKCDCGNDKTTQGVALRANRTTQCEECFSKAVSARSKIHGHSQHADGRDGICTATYQSWQSLRTRCLNPNRNTAKDYILRGIKVCDRWKEFKYFLEDMGLRPKGKTIDRIDNNGNYEPSNCRWATPKQQAQNQRPRNRKKGKPSL